MFKGTIQALNTRFSERNYQSKTIEELVEQIKTKLELIQNEILMPKDLIFSLDWLEKLVTCRFIFIRQISKLICDFSEKTYQEAKLSRSLLIHLIQSLTDIIDENLFNDKQ